MSFAVPSSENSIPENAFSTCSKLTEVAGLEKIISVGKWAFSQSGIRSIVWPSGARTIPTGAFYYANKVSILSPANFDV